MTQDRIRVFVILHHFSFGSHSPLDQPASSHPVWGQPGSLATHPTASCNDQRVCRDAQATLWIGCDSWWFTLPKTNIFFSLKNRPKPPSQKSVCREGNSEYLEWIYQCFNHFNWCLPDEVSILVDHSRRFWNTDPLVVDTCTKGDILETGILTCDDLCVFISGNSNHHITQDKTPILDCIMNVAGDSSIHPSFHWHFKIKKSIVLPHFLRPFF